MGYVPEPQPMQPYGAYGPAIMPSTQVPTYGGPVDMPPHQLMPATQYPVGPVPMQQFAPVNQFGLMGLGGQSQKSKTTAGLLGIFLGSFGVGRFYRGFIGLGFAQLGVYLFVLICILVAEGSPVGAGIGGLWGLIEGIVVLASKPGSPSSLDSNGLLMR
jgi:TM2 domain-containing membrane protein YozV